LHISLLVQCVCECKDCLPGFPIYDNWYATILPPFVEKGNLCCPVRGGVFVGFTNPDFVRTRSTALPVRESETVTCAGQCDTTHRSASTTLLSLRLRVPSSPQRLCLSGVTGTTDDFQ